MAQYYTDFSEYALNVQPPDWSRVSADSFNISEVQSSSTPSGSVLKLTDSTFGERVFAWDFDGLGGSVADCEILSKFREASTNTGYLLNIFRFQSAGNFYSAGWGSGRRRIMATIASSPTILATKAPDFSDTTPTPWYWIRSRITGDQLKLRIWLDGESEPVDWDYEITNSEFTFTGLVGFGNLSGRDNDMEVDIFSVGTNGDTALSSAPATGPDTPINPSVTNLLATSARLNWEQG
jgi:hypothetical protein